MREVRGKSGKRENRDPVRLQWHRVKKGAHYYITVNAITRPMMVWEDDAPYGKRDQ